MKKFDSKQLLTPIYQRFPEHNKRPLIGLTANYTDNKATIAQNYYNAIIAAGGTPLIIPPTDDTDVLGNIVDTIDALVLSGGADVNPLWMNEQPIKELGGINPTRDSHEIALIQLAYNKQLPILGICRGIQILTIVLGGKVYQDISNIPNVIKHDQQAPQTEPTHTVSISVNSILHDIFKTSNLLVNTIHHQAVSYTGNKLKVVAKAPDGIIEAVESSEGKPILGVQWHPEWLEEAGKPLFDWIVNEAVCFQKVKKLHGKLLTFDSHCDTPMFFAHDIQFHQRDSRILVDLHKMTDGMLDAVTMVAYLPQPKEGETFQQKVPFEVNGPRAYADLIFDKIEAIVNQHPQHIALARTPQQIAEAKAAGKKAIVLGIENGLALEGKVENVKHFAQRGITYITLCHNGDNDICDSAKGSNTHNGVSQLGAEIIAEMNRLGIMVDLSHGAEKSFYDALDISNQPIVCSHSNAKVLCDVPRNLTDDQLKALARKDGLVHITLYGGFLQQATQANIYDVMQHLEHIIRCIGVEHVGIGTDFDGDGGIPGWADASECLNFTRHLLHRKYSETDIESIWGGNWMRLLQHIQAQAKC